VILIGEKHQSKDWVHQRAQSRLIRHHQPDYFLHEILKDFDPEKGAEDEDIEDLARRPGKTVDQILSENEISNEELSDLEAEANHELSSLNRYADQMLGTLYSHRQKLNEWERFYEAVTGDKPNLTDPMRELKETTRTFREVDERFQDVYAEIAGFHGLVKYTLENSEGGWRPITAAYENNAEVAGCDLPNILEHSNHERELEMARRINKYVEKADSPIIAVLGADHLSEEERKSRRFSDDDGTVLPDELDSYGIDYETRILSEYEPRMTWNQFRNEARDQYEETGDFDISPPTVSKPDPI
ncbi:MAG: hypothetical protein ABEJ98_04485, partial [Candidatus Nanohaloarchaea archaeon]